MTEILAEPNRKPARLDTDRTAKPLTRIVSHPPAHWCVGPGMVLVDPEYEANTGERHPLT